MFVVPEPLPVILEAASLHRELRSLEIDWMPVGSLVAEADYLQSLGVYTHLQSLVLNIEGTGPKPPAHPIPDSDANDLTIRLPRLTRLEISMGYYERYYLTTQSSAFVSHNFAEKQVARIKEDGVSERNRSGGPVRSVRCQ